MACSMYTMWSWSFLCINLCCQMAHQNDHESKHCNQTLTSGVFCQDGYISVAWPTVWMIVSDVNWIYLYSVHSNISAENMDEVVDQVVVQNYVSESEEAPVSMSSGSSITSPTVMRSNVNKRKRSEMPDFLEWKPEKVKEGRKRSAEERKRSAESNEECNRMITITCLVLAWYQH